jgi:translation initiation factor 3 subunit L
MSTELQEAEEQIDVHDLPNFRFEGATQFDVNQQDSTTLQDASGSLAAQDAEADFSAYEMPDVIRSFVVYFQKNLRDRNVYEVHSIYENSFNKLTDRYYKNSSWPPAEVISPLVDGDQQFLLLYKELYYRHVYAKLQPTLEQRFESWANYCDIFNLLLSDSPVALELPNQWLWDIIDEFIYQFQAFSQFRSRVKGKTEEELATLKETSQAWNVNKVLFYLHALVDKSCIVATLNGESPKSPFASSELYKMMGYFALVGLLRVQCLLGDYRLALSTIAPMDLSKKGLFTRVTACHISVFYYVGFAYLMMRRYADATKTFSSILFYIGRTKQYHTRSYQYDQILKKNEQMYALLAITLSMSPQHTVDENLQSTLKEKFGERMARMQANNMDMGAYEDLFSFACPKFISPAAPKYDDLPANYNAQEAYKLQLRLFLQEVSQQKLLPTIRSFLKLYTTIGIPKLAALLEADEGTFREHLQCLKHKAHSLVWTGGEPLSGQWASCADVEFYVDDEMAHVADFSTTRRHMDFFVKQINKLEEIICNIKQ